MKNFSEFNLDPELNAAIAALNFTIPTPIQSEAIPLAIDGNDIIATSQTGTGKTVAFAVPLISHLLKTQEDKALVIAPTREIATQVIDVIKKLIPKNSKLKTALLIGGNPIPEQLRQMRSCPRIIVGTPGRINDHILRNSEDFSEIKFLVLDEIDRMLDMGFEIQIKQILNSINKTRQTLMFSATLPDEILRLAKKYLTNPARIAMDSVNLPKEQIYQETIRVSESEKYAKFLDQIEQREGSIIVFIKTKIDADKMATKLRENNHTADAMHGDLRQRQRDRVIRFFRNRKNRIMVATDVAARGLDIPHIEHVINYDLPHCAEDYIHRIGRTARAGSNGSALNLVSPSDDRKWKDICKLMGIKYDGPSDGFKKSKSVGERSRGRKDSGSKTFRERRENGRDSGSKTFGERREDRRDSGSKTFGEGRENRRNSGSKTFGERRENGRDSGSKTFGEGRENRRNSGSKTFGERRENGRDSGSKTFGEGRENRRNSGSKTFSERRENGRNSGFKTFGERRENGRDSGSKTFGERRENRRNSGSKTFGERRENGRDSSSKTFGERRENRRDSSSKTFGERRENRRDSNNSNSFNTTKGRSVEKRPVFFGRSKPIKK